MNRKEQKNKKNRRERKEENRGKVKRKMTKEKTMERRGKKEKGKEKGRKTRNIGQKRTYAIPFITQTCHSMPCGEVVQQLMLRTIAQCHRIVHRRQFLHNVDLGANHLSTTKLLRRMRQLTTHYRVRVIRCSGTTHKSR